MPASVPLCLSLCVAPTAAAAGVEVVGEVVFGAFPAPTAVVICGGESDVVRSQRSYTERGCQDRCRWKKT